MDWDKIKTPTLLLDESKCRRNIRSMAEKATSSGVVFRPHFKTHQSIEIGKWFREEGVNAITVSSVTMAKHFADAGWNDITIAFPLNLREVGDAEKLSGYVNLNILISGIEQAMFLSTRSKLNAGCFIEIDTGNKRNGIEWNDQTHLMRILDIIYSCESIRFLGFLTHSGHTYKSNSTQDIIDIYNDTLVKCLPLRALSPERTILSMGDTPACSLINSFKGFDEVRPGNFVFYDLTQYLLGSCPFENISIAVACPVVEKNQKRKEIVIYGGGVHLSKENVVTGEGNIVFGKPVLLERDRWRDPSGRSFVRSLSQEHGIIASSDELFDSVNVGGLVGIIPVHSCMTADLLREYHTFEDKLISDFSPK